MPVDPAPTPSERRDRENLAEVIELRAKITEIETREQEVTGQVLADATKILARKAMSSQELRKALERQEHPTPAIDEVIEQFERRKFLDDQALAEALTEKLRQLKRMSAGQISRKLSERGISREIIDETLATLDAEDETELMRAAAFDRARSLTKLDRVTAERRLAGYLARRGWGGSQMREIVREALDATIHS